ncbi:hypothetical protein Ae263Ps1_6415c [Pseudonocardia sp. Ae263_Ps1]|nr:hypothetical protein Ae263Ps1_6415c [Pseudonocardia sp. Ae263_Ps1]
MSAAIAELTAVGAVDVETVPTATGRRNVYTVHGGPPAGYTGLGGTQELIAFLAAEDAAAAAEVLAARPAGPPPPVAKPARSCPATSRTRRRASVATGRAKTRSGQQSPGQGGCAEKTAYPPNGGAAESLAMGGCAVFSADPSAEKTAQNDPKLNDPKGEGTRAGASRPTKQVAGPDQPPLPRSSRSETRPGHDPDTTVGAAEAALASELGAVTAALAQIATQLTTVLTAAPTAVPIAAPVPVTLPAIADAPDPDRPETWKCARHLAHPDPHDRPCGGCGAVRKHHEAQRDLRVAQAAQKRSEAARQVRVERDACTDCDEYGYLVDPDTGHTYDYALRCHHDGHGATRIAQHRHQLDTQTATTTRPAERSPIAQGAVDTIRALLAAKDTHEATHRPDQATDQAGRPHSPTPKAWKR